MFAWLKSFFARWDDALRSAPPSPPRSALASPEAPAKPVIAMPRATPPVDVEERWQPFAGPFGGHPELLATPARREALRHHVAVTTHGPAKVVEHSTTDAGYAVVEYTRPDERK